MAATDFLYASNRIEQELAVKNTDSTDFAFGDVVKLDTSNVVSGTQAVVGALQGTAAAQPLGVCLEAIPQGKVGRIAPLGPIVRTTASGAISAGAILAAAASGKVAAQTSGQAQLGMAITAAASNNDPLLAMLFGAKNA